MIQDSHFMDNQQKSLVPSEMKHQIHQIQHQQYPPAFYGLGPSEPRQNPEPLQYSSSNIYQPRYQPPIQSYSQPPHHQITSQGPLPPISILLDYVSSTEQQSNSDIGSRRTSVDTSYYAPSAVSQPTQLSPQSSAGWPQTTSTSQMQQYQAAKYSESVPPVDRPRSNSFASLESASPIAINYQQQLQHPTQHFTQSLGTYQNSDGYSTGPPSSIDQYGNPNNNHYHHSSYPHAKSAAMLDRQRRKRRKFDEINRIYKCSWHGCSKSYGTLNHLNHHIHLQGHGEKMTINDFRGVRFMARQAQFGMDDSFGSV
eukprot:Partr_v1_DN25777_c2_g1_i3_m74859 putative C2H2 transcription factor (Con7)